MLTITHENVMPLFIIFVLVPILEIMILLEVGSIIGSLWTFAIVILTAWVGAVLVKQQGLQTWGKMNRQIEQKELPTKVLFDGLCVLVSGVMLVTPGFFTDALGLFLLIPKARKYFYKKLESNIVMHSVTGSRQPFSFDDESADSRKSFNQPNTIEGEYTRKD